MSQGKLRQCWIDPQLEQMRQCDSQELLDQFSAEREAIMAKLRAPNIRATVSSNERVQDFGDAFTSESRQPALPAPVQKIKTRPDPADEVSLWAKNEAQDISSNSQTLSAVAVLYHIKEKSTASKVMRSIFPNPEEPESTGTISWQNLVNTMSHLGFTVDPRGGSIYTFTGEIAVPSSNEREKYSIGIHKPHPTPELGAVELRSLGKRFNRRFGWQREHFTFVK